MNEGVTAEVIVTEFLSRLNKNNTRNPDGSWNCIWYILPGTDFKKSTLPGTDFGKMIPYVGLIILKKVP